MLTLYEATTAVCAAKVRVTLAEKGLAYEGLIFDLGKGDQFDPAYLKLNPNGVVPTLLDGDTVVIESTVINEYLDDRFPTPPLRPENPEGRARMRLWTKREDGIHDVINTMTNVLNFRPVLMQKSEEERIARYAKIPNPAKREKWRSLLQDGVRSPIVGAALVHLARHFADMEAALEKMPHLAGAEFTLADSGLLSFFHRLDMLQCAWMWQEHFPRVSAWYGRCRGRPSFARAILAPIPESYAETYRALALPMIPMVREVFAEARAVG
jgi:glutathione S-transferase